MKTQQSNSYYLIVGMGATGISIAHYLLKKGRKFHFFDTRAALATSETLKKLFPSSELFFQTIDDEILLNAEEVYISPGVARDEHLIQKALQAGKSVVGDIELFLREATKPVVGITGSNGKSTLTTMLGLAAQRAGINVAIGGNIGTPALSLLDGHPELFILELSSFQLESTVSQSLRAACILNVSEDHMDRYDSFDSYVAAKQRIFLSAQNLIFNAGDRSTWPGDSSTGKCLIFGVDAPAVSEAHYQSPTFYFDAGAGDLKADDKILINKHDIRCKGMHNVENALALFALAEAIGIDTAACVNTLNAFPGLPHRCQIIAEKNGVTFINDSKATNTGAAKAAITGLSSEFNGLILIAGGDGKGADFVDLGKCIENNVRGLVLIGKDANIVSQAVGGATQKVFASDMGDALRKAFELAQNGDAVLLAPACASFDMFENFEARGNIFIDCVNRLDDQRRAL